MPLIVDLHDQLNCQKSNEGRSNHKSSNEDNRLGLKEKGKNEKNEKTGEESMARYT